MGIRLLSYDELKPQKGICYSKVQLWRLERDNRFPRRVPIGPARHGWAEHEIDAWLKDRLAARYTAAVAA